MRIAIVTAGSRGDVQPFIALALGLKHAGYDAYVAAPRNYRNFVESNGVEYFQLNADWEKLIKSDGIKKIIDTGNYLGYINIKRQLDDVLTRVSFDAYRACEGADLIIYATAFPIGETISEKTKIPCIEAAVGPAIPTRYYPIILTKGEKEGKSLLYYLFTKAFTHVWWQVFRKPQNILRKSLGLKKLGFFHYYDRQKKYHVPILGIYSDLLYQKPTDWPNNVYVTGFWFLEDNTGWKPSPELQKFLDAGPKPVFIGFGSMTSNNAQDELNLIVKALEKSGQRGIVLSGWREFGDSVKLPETVFLLKSAPIDKLFPYVAAAVQHGGAGTLSATIRAGIPAVVVPHIIDQSFWGYRAYKLGIGTKPIPHRELTADTLAEAIKTAVEDRQMQKNAAEMGEKLRAEDGIKKAVEVIEKLTAKQKAAV